MGEDSPTFRTVVVPSFFQVKQSKNNTKPDETHRYRHALPHPEPHESTPHTTVTNELPSTPEASRECPLFSHPNQNFLRMSNLSRVLYAISVSPSLTLISPEQIMRLFVTRFSPVSCHLLPPHALSCRLDQRFSTAGPRPGTGPWHQLYRAARGSPGICHFSFLSNFHE